MTGAQVSARGLAGAKIPSESITDLYHLTLPVHLRVTRTGVQSSTLSLARSVRWPTLALALCLLLLQSARSCRDITRAPLNQLPADANVVHWRSCGAGFDAFQCANVSVPLDYHNTSDPRTVSIAVTRYPATDMPTRQGAVFMNPGGPGGSGTAWTFSVSSRLSKVLRGQYDLIGFDPRGVNLTAPSVSCFDTRLDQDVFMLSMRGFELDLPATISDPAGPTLVRDLEGQIAMVSAGMEALAHKCAQHTGEAFVFMGTEAVVRDIDTLARLIEGEDNRVNYWGWSYGTVIGQYLIQILPPSRIGRVIIDSVIDPTQWSDYSTSLFDHGQQSSDAVLQTFASTCLQAGSACALSSSFLSASALLAKIDVTIDTLYASPVPVHGLSLPAVATASHLRTLIGNALYDVQRWPRLAERLAAAFAGDFSGVLNDTMLRVSPDGARAPMFAPVVILCSDAKPYTRAHPPPTTQELAARTLGALRRYSRRTSDRGTWLGAHCAAWDRAGLAPRRARFAGPFGLADGTLDTPVLILSNTHDAATPLALAFAALERLGTNARLVEQVGGVGHCTYTQPSRCTARVVQAYMLTGVVPDEAYTACAVDRAPWAPPDEVVDAGALVGSEDSEGEWERAWKEFADGWADNVWPSW